MRSTRLLEQEIARLREENRALVNSILGIAGIPPMRIAGQTQEAQSAGATHGSPLQGKHCDYEKTTTGVETNLPIVPLRRRSWQQLGRAREIEDARAVRRERETDEENFPAPPNIVSRQ